MLRVHIIYPLIAYKNINYWVTKLVFGDLKKKNVGGKYTIDFHPDQETINVIIVIKPLLKMTKNLYQRFDITAQHAKCTKCNCTEVTTCQK